MTQEDKDLLIKDLCARLPYGVKFHFYPNKDSKQKEVITTVTGYDGDYQCVETKTEGFNVRNIKLYLRPMSNMTEEERKYISDRCGFSISGPIGNEWALIMPVLAADWLVDFYNEHHLDHRGLIPMGLALEAPEGMYKLDK